MLRDCLCAISGPGLCVYVNNRRIIFSHNFSHNKAVNRADTLNARVVARATAVQSSSPPPS